MWHIKIKRTILQCKMRLSDQWAVTCCLYFPSKCYHVLLFPRIKISKSFFGSDLCKHDSVLHYSFSWLPLHLVCYFHFLQVALSISFASIKTHGFYFFIWQAFFLGENLSVIYMFVILQFIRCNSRRFLPSQADEEAHQLSYLQKHMANILTLLADSVEGEGDDSMVSFDISLSCICICFS